MNWNRADELLAKFYAGESSEEEEQELKQLLSANDLPEYLQADAALFGQMAQANTDETSLSEAALFSRLDEQLQLEEPAVKSKGKTIQLPVKMLWQIAAAFALLAIGYWAGSQTEAGVATAPQQQTERQNEQLARISREVEEMKQMLAQNSPSARIKAVAQVQEIEKADDELIQALIQTMHFDENVNVRMAAIQALLHYREQPEVRKALTQSLRIQENPNVQLLLIDGLVEMEEKEALPEMQELLKDPALQDAVRMRLQEGIGTLI